MSAGKIISCRAVKKPTSVDFHVTDPVVDFNPLSGAQCCCFLGLERTEELEGPRGLSIQDDETVCSPVADRRHFKDN